MIACRRVSACFCGQFALIASRFAAAHQLRFKSVSRQDAPPQARGKGTGPMKLGIRQGIASAAVFGAVLLMLISVDDRVRDRFSDLVGGSGSLSPWGDRAGDLGHALMSAVRYQSIENAPLLIFAAAGAVLVAFMLRT